MSNENCESGCNCFTGGEIRHQRTCVNYPDSLTEMYDLAMAKINYLEDNKKQIIKEAYEDSERIKGLEQSLSYATTRITTLDANILEREKELSVAEQRNITLKDRLEKTHNAYGNEIEKNDRLCEEIEKLRSVIKRRNEVIRLLGRDLE